MGWRAFYKNGKTENEDDPGVGRPVQAGENGELLAIAQEDFGKNIAVDLVNGAICLGYSSIDFNDQGQLTLQGAGIIFFICEETNIIGDFKHLKQDFIPVYSCNKTRFENVPVGDTTENREVACPVQTEPGQCSEGHEVFPLLQTDGSGDSVTVRTDILLPLTWRPIWFTRNTNGIPTKVIGAQTTTPAEIDNTGKDRGSRNIKKLVLLFADGRLGID